ncbi:uncharacterized protein LY89DRAFT_433374 [Mollisia scopiformis]|uniref:BHLH domain-containing protein n=1 Tax=Mollisia scopiformis TaxID=149040 RepID=A0A194XMF2_MOLSC|nr:uncharacterized protein LY89DRAFT_433374 [Mollisia scopiformis]KUJ21425.1 hypothetical protein LY89DRAFT_433374 [Mollisia scopiformis]
MSRKRSSQYSVSQDHEGFHDCSVPHLPICEGSPTIALSLPAFDPLHDSEVPELTTASTFASFDDPASNPFDESFANIDLWENWDENQTQTGYNPTQQLVEGYTPIFSGSSFSLYPTPPSTGTQTSQNTSKNPYLLPLTKPNEQQGDVTPGYSYESSARYNAVHTPCFGYPNMVKSVQKHWSNGNATSPFPTEIASLESPSAPRSPKTIASNPYREQRSRSKQHTIEKRYRARLSEEFALLLAALPEKLIASEITGLGGLQIERGLSKMDILDLAKKYIGQLEKEGIKLKQVGRSLQLDVDAFKRIYDDCRRQTSS